LLFNIYYMIIDKKIEVKIDRRNIEHYSLFYKSIKLKDIIEINTELHLQKGSNIKINVSCDICNIERYIKYQAYTKNINSCKDYTIYTCDKCSHIKLKNYNIKKYGVEYYSQHPDRNDKVKKTCLNKYGVEHFSKSELFNEKVHKTNLEKFGFINPFMDTERIKGIFKEKYGVEHPAQFEKFNNKIKETNLERYGYKSVLSSPIIREKIEKTNIIKYGYTSPMKSNLIRIKTKIGSDENYLLYLENYKSSFKCDNEHVFNISSSEYHNRIRSSIPLCTICYPIGDQKSIKEKELLKFIKSVYSGEIVSSYRDSLEIDIYLPELKLGFEFNGLYWHSNKFKEKNYHLNKTDWFKEKGIRIIHIWEDDWILRREIVESQIKNSIGLNTNRIFARKCYIKEVDVKIARKFLNENHIQGFVNSSNKLGLYYNEDLVSIMTFDNNEGRKKMELFGYNLNRFCNKKGINVIGGASKLLSHFIKSFDATRIVSYADKDWSIGDLYYKLGFINVGGNGPDYKYIVDNKRVHKSRYKKSKLNTTLTESKQMEKDGFLKIYDCGKLKFELKIIKKSYN
jgi:hypothetical protein